MENKKPKTEPKFEPNGDNFDTPHPNLKDHHHVEENNNNNREQDKFLPIANVGRIMKKVIPSNGKISKDAKETVQECVSEFISFITGEASDKCQKEKRKTINGEDIIWAITILGFEEYVAPLKLYLARYRDLEGDQKPSVQKMQQSHQQRVTDQSIFGNNQQNFQCLSGFYNTSATNLVSPSPLGPINHPFSLPYPSTSIPKQEHQQQQF